MQYKCQGMKRKRIHSLDNDWSFVLKYFFGGLLVLAGILCVLVDLNIMEGVRPNVIHVIALLSAFIVSWMAFDGLRDCVK